MPKTYKRKCNTCENEYKGFGEYFCSQKCVIKKERAHKMLSCFFCRNEFYYNGNYKKYCSSECLKQCPILKENKVLELEKRRKAGKISGFQKGHRDFVPVAGRKRQAEKISKIAKEQGWNPGGNWWKKKGLAHPRTGTSIPHNIVARKKMSCKKQGIELSEWNGFISAVNLRIRKLPEYIQWRNNIFKRDKYTCCFCGYDKGGKIQADHIKPFSIILRENAIKNIEQAKKLDELWDINN